MAACAPGTGSVAAVVRGAVARPDASRGRSWGGTAEAAAVEPATAVAGVPAGVGRGAAAAVGAARACCVMHTGRSAVGSATGTALPPATLETPPTTVSSAACRGAGAGRSSAGEVSPSCRVAGLVLRGGRAATSAAHGSASTEAFLPRRLPNLFMRLITSSLGVWTAGGARCRDLFRRGTLRTVGAPDKLRSP